METTEIIAELRRLLEVGDSPVFCGGTFISKQLVKEAADRLESLDKRWKRTVVERDQARAMRGRAERLLAEKTSGDLISRRAVLAALSSRLSIVDMVGVAEIVEAVEAEPSGEIPYERLLKIAKKMHLWIFHHSFDEQEAYDECGLTDEENAILGYGGQLVFEEVSDGTED